MMEKNYNEEYVINVLTEHSGLIMKYGRLFSNANATNNIYSELNEMVGTQKKQERRKKGTKTR